MLTWESSKLVYRRVWLTRIITVGTGSAAIFFGSITTSPTGREVGMRAISPRVTICKIVWLIRVELRRIDG